MIINNFEKSIEKMPHLMKNKVSKGVFLGILYWSYKHPRLENLQQSDDCFRQTLHYTGSQVF